MGTRSVSNHHLPYTIEQYANREAWLRGRGQTIGASEVGVILGVSKWQSPFALWARKRGIFGENQPSSEQRWGWLMESAIGNWFQDETGWRVKFDGLRILRSKPWPFLSCTLDGLVIPGLAGIQFDGIDEIFHDEFSLELKNLNDHVKHEWKDQPPVNYWCQTQMQMAIMGTNVAVLACCIGGNEGRWFPVLRDEKFIQRSLPRVQAFWQAVQDGEQPSVDGHETTRQALQFLFDPPKRDKRIELPEEILPYVAAFDAASNMADIAEEQRDKAANFIRHAMGDAEIAECPGNNGFTWRKQRDGKRPLKRVAKLPKDLSEVLNP